MHLGWYISSSYFLLIVPWKQNIKETAKFSGSQLSWDTLCVFTFIPPELPSSGPDPMWLLLCAILRPHQSVLLLSLM